MKNLILLVFMVGLAHYAAAAGFRDRLMKHKVPPAPVPPVDISGPRECTTVPELAAADGNFSILLAAAQAAGLDSVLADPELSGTLFAPTDAAFAALLEELQLSPEELLGNTELLTKVLSYHFVPAVVVPTSAMSDAQKLPTLLTANTPTMHKYVKEATMLVVNKDKRISLKHPWTKTDDIAIIPSGGVPAEIVVPNLPACKVIVHVIDTVLIPELEPSKAKVAVSGVPSGTYGKYGH